MKKQIIEIDNDYDYNHNLLFKQIIDLKSTINHYTRKRDMNKINILNITLKNKINLYDKLYNNSDNIQDIPTVPLNK